MSCIDPFYNETGGVYVSVRPVSDVRVPSVKVPEWLTFKPVPEADLHITLAYNAAVKPSRPEIDNWIATQCIAEFTSWRAAAVPAVAAWANGDRLYIGLEFYSPELFALHESIKSSLNVPSSFPDYKCHMTFGSFRGLPQDILGDHVFISEFVRQYVGAANNGTVELSMLRFANAED